MSAAVSGIRGGQPSTTQPIAGPWLSPKVVNRNRCPNVLNDIEICRVSGTPHSLRGQFGRAPRPTAHPRTRARLAHRTLSEQPVRTAGLEDVSSHFSERAFS